MNLHLFCCGIFDNLLFLEKLLIDSIAFWLLKGHVFAFFEAHTVSDRSPKLGEAIADPRPKIFETSKKFVYERFIDLKEFLISIPKWLLFSSFFLSLEVRDSLLHLKEG